MRVPILAVFFLVVSVVGGTWWWNTRNKDFMTPPTEAKLEQIRARVESSFPRADEVKDPEPAIAEAKEPEPPPVVEPPKPPVDTGDLTTPPSLQDYGLRAPEGTEPMIGLARALEEKGEFQRALLAWERVIDMTKPDAAQAATAISSIKRLRPTLPDWNTKPETAITITLQAGTGKKLAKDLKPVLEGVAKDIERASSGIVKVKPVITVGKTSAKGATPVALWLAGSGKKPVSTEVISFTIESPEGLRQEIMKNVFVHIRSHLSRSTAFTPPSDLVAGENPQEALSSRITRLSWNEFANALNLPPKKPK